MHTHFKMYALLQLREEVNFKKSNSSDNNLSDANKNYVVEKSII